MYCEIDAFWNAGILILKVILTAVFLSVFQNQSLTESFQEGRESLGCTHVSFCKASQLSAVVWDNFLLFHQELRTSSEVEVVSVEEAFLIYKNYACFLNVTWMDDWIFPDTKYSCSFSLAKVHKLHEICWDPKTITSIWQLHKICVKTAFLACPPETRNYGSHCLIQLLLMGTVVEC